MVSDLGGESVHFFNIGHWTDNHSAFLADHPGVIVKSGELLVKGASTLDILQRGF